MLHWILDLVLLLILVVTVWKGVRNGLVPGIAAIVALTISLYGANLLANTYSQEFTSVLEPFVSGLIDNGTEQAEAHFEELGIEPSVYDMAYETLRGIGVMKSAGSGIAAEMKLTVHDTGHVLHDALVDTLCLKLAYVLMLAVVFLLLAIVFAVIGNIINLSFMLPGLELINKLLGGAFGLLKGLFICFFIAWLLRFTGLALKETVVDDTVLLRLLMNANPLIGLLNL